MKEVTIRKINSDLEYGQIEFIKNYRSLILQVDKND